MNRLPLQLLMLIFAGWMNRHQQAAIEYLQEENRLLREQLGGGAFGSTMSSDGALHDALIQSVVADWPS